MSQQPSRAARPDRRTFLRGAAVGVAGGGLFSLAGCGGCGAKNDPNLLKVVSSLPRTGSAQGQTDTIVNGIKMALEEAAGTVGSLRFDYEDRDDATAAAGGWDGTVEAANARGAAADPNVMVFIGPYNSGAAKQSIPELNDAGLVQISPACTAIELTKPVEGDTSGAPGIYRKKGVTFCRVCPNDILQGTGSAQFVFEDLKARKVYILDDTEVYGRGIANMFEKKAKELGMTVLGHEGIVTTQNDFVQLMTKIRAAGPDAVYFGGTTQSKGGQVVKDMKGVGLNVPVVVPDGCYENAFIESVGAQNLANVYATMGGFDPSKLTGAGAEFVKKYKAKYGKDPEAYAIYGYEAGKVFTEAVKKVGRKDRQAIREAVLATKDFTAGALGKWSFDADGDTTLEVLTISKIENGKFVPVKTVTAK